MKILWTLISLTLKFVAEGYNLNILLEKFDDSAGGGLLFGAPPTHCDPFWFTGLDECDIALKICVEAVGETSPSLGNCLKEWIDLGQVTNNSNIIRFSPDTTYGGWSNPMTYFFPGISWQGFQVKLISQDVDSGSRQLIDQMLCQFALNGTNDRGIEECSHMRPCGYPTNLRLSYIHYTGPIPTPSPTPPCVHGSLSVSHVCICYRNWNGSSCNVPICSNNGTINGTNCICPAMFSGYFCEIAPRRHCADLYEYGGLRSDGIYDLLIDGRNVSVYCEMRTGGWTLIQRRTNDSQSFNQSWKTYASGFGQVSAGNSFWLGNDFIHSLTTVAPMTLEIDMSDCSGHSASATYSSFKISDSSKNYTLVVSQNVSGAAGDSFNMVQFGMTQNKQMFSTFDWDNSVNKRFGCPGKYNGWWYGVCGGSELNGNYVIGCKGTKGIRWQSWLSSSTSSLFSSVMKIRPVGFTP